MFRLFVYDRNGIPLAELTGITRLKRSWALNKYGVMSFDIPINHPKATRELLASQNRLVCFADTGLEPWAGIIVARDWNATHITVTANSRAASLERTLIQSIDLDDVEASEMFSTLFNLVNQAYSTGVFLGELPSGGVTHSWHPKALSGYKLLQQIQQYTGYDWDVTYESPAICRANLYPRKGLDKTASVLLIWGRDIENEPKYTEDETQLANRITAIGAGEKWEDRPKVTYEDTTSILQQGLFEDAIEFDDISQLDTLLLHARTAVEQRKRPRRTLEFSINNSRGMFSEIGDGDVVSVFIPKYGFTGLYVPVRVLGRELEEETEVLTLATELVDMELGNLLDNRQNFSYGSGGEYVHSTAANIAGTGE